METLLLKDASLDQSRKVGTLAQSRFELARYRKPAGSHRRS